MFATCSCVSRAAAFRGKRLNAECVWKKCPPSAAHATHAGMQVITRARANTYVGAWRSWGAVLQHASGFRVSISRPRDLAPTPHARVNPTARTYERIDALCASPRSPPLSSPVSARISICPSVIRSCNIRQRSRGGASAVATRWAIGKLTPAKFPLGGTNARRIRLLVASGNDTRCRTNRCYDRIVLGCWIASEVILFRTPVS